MTQSVDRLENLGLVSGTTRRGDRRLVLAEITPEGRSLVPAARQIIETVASRFITETLTGRQAAALASALAKVVAASRQPSPEPDPVS